MKFLASSAVLFCVGTAILMHHSLANSQSVSEEATPFNISSQPIKSKSLEIGEWGELSYHPIVLEPPSLYFYNTDWFDKWNTKTVWMFDVKEVPEVQELLRQSGFSEELVLQLTQPEFLSKNEVLNWLEIAPPEDVVLGMTESQRTALYPTLMPQNTKNPFFKPFTLPNGGIESVAHIPTGFPEAQLDKIKKLSFHDGNQTKLSDIHLLMRNAVDDVERLRILKTLSRQKSLSVRLKVAPQTDLQTLATYWGAGGKNKDVQPILESVIQTSGASELDIVHLLPPTPRKLLHIYPSPAGEGLGADMPDCFWTAFGFFADTPPDRHLDFVGHVLSERYERAEKPLQLGDLVVFSQEGTPHLLHACNYVAAGLVFTKNGMSMGRPWVITPLQEVAESYLSNEGFTISFFRLKPEYQK